MMQTAISHATPEPTCPTCQASYPPGSRFCPSDGTRLTAKARAPHESGMRRAGASHPLLVAGRYLKVQALGEGAQGDVSLAQDIHTGEMLALKHFPSDVDVARCEAEIRAAKQIQDHAHIVAVRALEQDPMSGRRFLTMEYLEGHTLEQHLARGDQFGIRQAVTILLQAARGLAELHAHALVHRDIKPANIMLCGPKAAPRVKLLDLGIAKSLAPDAERLTIPGAVVGTLDYAAPEQLRGERATPAFDIYALGVVAHQLLEGRLPGEPASSMCAVPSGLRLLVDQMLQADRARRPPHMSHICSALERAERWLDVRPPARRAGARIPTPEELATTAPLIPISEAIDPCPKAAELDAYIPKRAFLPRFTLAATGLAVAVLCLFAPVLDSQGPATMDTTALRPLHIEADLATAANNCPPATDNKGRSPSAAC